MIQLLSGMKGILQHVLDSFPTAEMQLIAIPTGAMEHTYCSDFDGADDDDDDDTANIQKRETLETELRNLFHCGH